MQYVIDQENRVLVVHDNHQDIARLYPAFRIIVSDESYDLDEVIPDPQPRTE